MTLVRIDGNGDARRVDSTPHRADYDRWRAGLTDAEHLAVVAELARRMGDKQIETAGFLPGADWTGTPFWPIYASACGQDFDAARKFFGIIVWEYLRGRPDCWSFGRYTVRNVPVESLTYFRVDCPD